MCRLQLWWASLAEVVDVDCCGMQKRSCSTAASVQLRERARNIGVVLARNRVRCPGNIITSECAGLVDIDDKL